MIFYGKTFSEKQREQKGRDYDRDMRNQRNAIIEECALVVESFIGTLIITGPQDIAAALRARKDKP